MSRLLTNGYETRGAHAGRGASCWLEQPRSLKLIDDALDAV